MESENNDRRLKVVNVRCDDVLAIFNAYRGESGVLSVPVFKELPDGYVVKGARYDFERDAISFLVSHPSFAVVGVAECVPVFGGLIESRQSAYRVGGDVNDVAVAVAGDGEVGEAI